MAARVLALAMAARVLALAAIAWMTAPEPAA
jgi:hypothetical protein